MSDSAQPKNLEALLKFLAESVDNWALPLSHTHTKAETHSEA